MCLRRRGEGGGRRFLSSQAELREVQGGGSPSVKRGKEACVEEEEEEVRGRRRRKREIGGKRKGEK